MLLNRERDIEKDQNSRNEIGEDSSKDLSMRTIFTFLGALMLMFNVVSGTESPVDTLLKSLPQVPEIVQENGTVHWKSGDSAVNVTAVDPASGDLVVDTGIGSLHVDRRLIEARCSTTLVALPELIKQAQAHGLTARTFVLQESHLVGPCLHSPEVMVVPQGMLRRQAIAAVDRSPTVARVTEAIQKLRAALPTSRLDDIGQRSVIGVLQRLDGRDGGQALDEVWPSVARRIARHGWLRPWFPPELAEQARQAITAAEEMQPTIAFSGDGLRLEQVQDGFGHGGWIYHTPTHMRYDQTEIQPEYLGHLADLMVVVELPPGADPAHDADKAVAAWMYRDHQEVAAWTAAGGLICDHDRWKSAVAVRSANLVGGAMPPHIRISDLHGDVAGLAVTAGLLRPAADSSHAAAERFLDDAAHLLPDAAHLDLIGEYLFTYVYPSPDAQHPELIGNKQIKGNVQQTVWQTCGNVTGGIMRGDCADIAELYHAITSKQARNPVIIGLPEHAACAWAEQHDHIWHVFVLQTGPPLEFTDATLPACLGKAYTSFDPSMAFDPNAVPLLLRFSGEVTRSSWQLSWRIFSDPKYASTMIEVQRDWHFQTYQRGIVAVRDLIAHGDHDNANFRELAGLSTFTGQYDLAADYHRQALDLVTDPVNHLTMSIELVSRLMDAGKVAEARTTAKEILKQLPTMKAALGDSAQRISLDLVGACLNAEGGPALRDLAVQALRDPGGADLEESITKLSSWLASNQFNRETWENDTSLRAVRGLISDYVEHAIAALTPVDGQHLPNDIDSQRLTSAVQQWLNGFAFCDVEENSMVILRYATAGRWYACVLGQDELDRRLASAPLPDLTIDHTHRVGGAEQVEHDLPWIRASVPYWYGRLADLFRRDRATLDVKEVARLSAQLAEARIATARLGLADSFSESRAELGIEIAALVAHDETTLRHMLHRVAEHNDKELRDDAAQWLGDSARFLEPTWYARVLLAWQEVVDYKPKYFWIAWRAALNHAPQQALMAAKLAAERFSDDTAFSEEYGFMCTLLEHPLTPATTEPPLSVTH